MAGNKVQFSRSDLVDASVSFHAFEIDQEARVARIRGYISTLQEAGRDGMAGGKGDVILESAEQISQVIDKIAMATKATSDLLKTKLIDMQLMEEVNGKVAAMQNQTSDLANKTKTGLLKK